MSFILSNVKRVWRADAQGDDTKIVLKTHNPCTFALPSAKLVNLIQPYLLNNKSKLALMTDVESFLLKSQKLLYLKQIEYHLPGIIYWKRPESALFLAVRLAAMKVSGETNPEVIENVIDQNDGIFEFFKNFFDTVVNVYKYSLRKQTGISKEMERKILLALMEWLGYQQVRNVKNPVLHSNLISKLYPVEICPGLDISQTDCFDRKEITEVNFVNYHFFCFVCQQHFAKSADLKTHLKTHTKFVCNMCEVDYEDYKDLCTHRLTFCRGASDKKCSFCLQVAKECFCAKYFQATIEDTRLMITRTQRPETTQFFTEIYQYYNDNILKPINVTPVSVCQGYEDIQGIMGSAWPNLVPPEKNTDRWAMPVGEFDIYGRNVMVQELKKQCMSRYFTNYIQFDIIKMDLLPYFRDTCHVDKCTFDMDYDHYFGSHFRCPLASQMTNDETPALYSSEDLARHLSIHLDDSWEFQGVSLTCNQCKQEISGEGDLSLEKILEHSFMHKHTGYPLKCQTQTTDICREIDFANIQEHVFHMLTLHYKTDKEFQKNLLTCVGFQESIGGTSQISQILGTPKVSKSFLQKSLFDVNKAMTVDKAGKHSKDGKQISFTQFDQSGTSGNKHANIVNNSTGSGCTQGPSGLTTGLANNSPPIGDEGDFQCCNENHKEPMKFKTQEHKDYHVIKSHKCIAQNCHFSNEFEFELLKHYKHFHSKTKNVCQLCGMGFNDRQEHYDSYHFDCTSCKTWFATLTDLKAHETQCFNVVSNGPVQRQTNTSFINSTVEKESLMIDQTDTDNDFCRTLLGILDSSNLPEEIKQKYEMSIKRNASESLITKSRLRAECFSDFRSQELLFDVPKWNDNVSRDAVGKIHTVLGTIRDSDIFRASSKSSHKNAVINFECIEAAQNRISRTTTICGLSEAHGTILLQNFLSQQVRDEICGYNKTAELLNLSYRRILESLQFLYVNIKLSVLESRIMSYRIQESETIYQFTNRATRHLTLCAKKFETGLRAAYIENNLAKLLRGNVPPKVLAEINRKESVFSPYTSTEILDIYKNVMSRDDQNLDQYEVMFTRGVKAENKSTLRGRSSKFDKKAKSSVRNVEKVSKPPSQISQKSRERMQMLGPRIVKEGERICFKCLQKHEIQDCEIYKGIPLTEKLCYKQEGNRRKPCGFHFGSCKSSSKKFSNIKIDGDVRGRQPSPSVWQPRR